MTLLDYITFFAVLAAIFKLWGWASDYRIGRLGQAAVVSLVYSAWLSIIPLVLIIMGGNLARAWAKADYGEFAFVIGAFALMSPIMVFPLIPWNHYCRYIFRKTGLKLRQSAKLGGKAEYQDWQRDL